MNIEYLSADEPDTIGTCESCDVPNSKRSFVLEYSSANSVIPVLDSPDYVVRAISMCAACSDQKINKSN